MKPRLLVVSDAVVHTGFARVFHNIAPRLNDEWDMTVIGVNYIGDPHPYPYRIYPAGINRDMWGIARFRELVSKLKPHVALVINDPWIVARFIEHKASTALVAYMPIDAKNQNPEICRQLSDLDMAIWYTDFGRREAEAAGWSGCWTKIPHGVDSELYRPMDRRAIRNRMRYQPTYTGDVVANEPYIVGCVNRNQPRKRLDLTIEYFAEWVHQHHIPDNVYLYLHCAHQDSGWNLAELAYYHGVSRRLMMPPEEAFTAAEGFPEELMPWVYNSFDLQISTSAGEGWGLTTHEGMACAIPQIVPDFSGLGEWTTGAAWKIPCSATMAHVGVNTVGAIPDKAAFVKALHTLYTNEGRRRHLAERALVRARDPRFRWSKIADAFQRYLGEALQAQADKLNALAEAEQAEEKQCLDENAAVLEG